MSTANKGATAEVGAPIFLLRINFYAGGKPKVNIYATRRGLDSGIKSVEETVKMHARWSFEDGGERPWMAKSYDVFTIADPDWKDLT